MSVVAKWRGEDKVPVEFFSFDALSLDVIMEGEDRDAFVMEVREEERGEGPGSFAVMNVLDNQETVGELGICLRLETCWSSVTLRAHFVDESMIFLGVLGVMKSIGIHERAEGGRVHGNPPKG